MDRFVNAYESACSGYTLNYTSSGSGAGGASGGLTTTFGSAGGTCGAGLMASSNCPEVGGVGGVCGNAGHAAHRPAVSKAVRCNTSKRVGVLHGKNGIG